MADHPKVSEETREKCIEAVARNAWADMTKDAKGKLPTYDNMPTSMLAPMRAQVRATLEPIWNIIENGA